MPKRSHLSDSTLGHFKEKTAAQKVNFNQYTEALHNKNFTLSTTTGFLIQVKFPSSFKNASQKISTKGQFLI